MNYKLDNLNQLEQLPNFIQKYNNLSNRMWNGLAYQELLGLYPVCDIEHWEVVGQNSLAPDIIVIEVINDKGFLSEIITPPEVAIWQKNGQLFSLRIPVAKYIYHVSLLPVPVFRGQTQVIRRIAYKALKHDAEFSYMQARHNVMAKTWHNIEIFDGIEFTLTRKITGEIKVAAKCDKFLKPLFHMLLSKIGVENISSKATHTPSRLKVVEDTKNQQQISGVKYQDFQILVANDGKMRVSSEQGEVRDELQLDVSRIQSALEAVEMRQTNDALLKSLGNKLYQALFPTNVRVHLQATLASAQATESNVRLRLIFESPKLAALPWELIYDESANKFLGNDISTALSRYIDVGSPKRNMQVGSTPLNILLVISNPSNMPQLDSTEEEYLIREALKKHIIMEQIELDVLSTATLHAIRRKIQEKPYHIFHFIGHGFVTAQANKVRTICYRESYTNELE